ncbi:hypothetical protein HBA55_12680 [Pseudomaricurvus alkylphenolicus]|uniref:hypothetical protein n=1 Tax=Pseudomaricurvus alkylphenolicus TaxID=1306991 RepID=UPI00141EBCE2|nr:hypothetical protein [Pseudomaricurvus alkylphenolicus]NIB40448.1 hypothetical protein [Pseudomaricurvus alkylphenolicus]
MKLLLRLSLGLGVLALLGVFGLVWVLSHLIDDQPLVDPPLTANPQQVYHAKQLVKRTLRLMQRQQPDRLDISYAELQSLNSLLARAYPIHSHFNPTTDGLWIRASIELPDNIFGRYLSLQLHLPVSPQQLQLTNVQLGSITLPDSWTRRLLPSLVERVFGQQQGQLLLDLVRLQQAQEDQLQLLIQPPSDPRQQLSRLLERLRSFDDNSGLDSIRIAHYYDQLLREGQALEPHEWVSLSYFLAPLMLNVQQQAAEGEQHLHARSAILALSLYLGSHHFEQLTGPVLNEQQRQNPPHHRTLLRGRIDLRLHFVYSAAIQVLGDAGSSYAIGEFKEMLDSVAGGSGFSFADLAADRAGTLFAMRASRDPQQAAELLARFDLPLQESDLMIPINRLPEGLSQAEFRQRYGDIDSEAYRRLTDQIDQQLLALRLYRDDAQG